MPNSSRRQPSPEPTPSARIRRDGIAPELNPELAELEPLLGRYRVMDLRDVGGFGSVLVCWDVRLQRRVAVKCLPLDLGASTVTLDEALAEARASSFLAHPNIVTVHDFEVDDDYAYLVMEYVDGVTLAELRQRVEGGVLIFDEAAYVLRCLASALSFAHANGVLHLDIKPQNVMIDRTGQVKLGDFGMASLASAAGWGGARGGTVGYMAPEQLEGELVDERSDVFSLAVVVYEALTGRQPFAAPTAEKSLALIERGATPIGELDPEMDPAVAEAIMGALAPDASLREPSVARFAESLLAATPVTGRDGQPLAGPDGLPVTAGALGDPEAGRASILRLLSQAKEEEPEFDEEPWRNLDPPGRRIPHLATILARFCNMALTALVVGIACGVVGLEGLGSVAAAAICGVAAFAWAPLGSALGIAALGVSLLSQGLQTRTAAEGAEGVIYATWNAGYLGLGALVIALGVAWWLWFGRGGRLASSACLAPTALLQPLLAPGLAGYALRPLAAALTGAFACALALAAQSAFSESPWALALVALAPRGSVAAGAADLGVASAQAAQAAGGPFDPFLAPSGWISMAGCALGALACALLNRMAARRLLRGAGGARALACLGQCAAAAFAFGALAWGDALEYGARAWLPVGPDGLVLLGFLAIMLIVTGLFGPVLDLAAPSPEPGGPARA